jgi:pteridine reductase
MNTKILETSGRIILMSEQPLIGKTILITGAARRLGRIFALTCARAGADIIIHHGHSEADAESLASEIKGLGLQALIFEADLSDSTSTRDLIQQINRSTPLHGLINSAAIFESLTLASTSIEDWNKHLAINLTAPFLLSQSFAQQAEAGARIVNIVDWRALRPGADHFPYTVSKSALAAMTKSLAIALAPKITVNALALGAILPPADRNKNPDIIKNVPVQRWAQTGEVEEALLFLLTCPAYVTGEIIHVDGGRHLV